MRVRMFYSFIPVVLCRPGVSPPRARWREGSRLGGAGASGAWLTILRRQKIKTSRRRGFGITSRVVPSQVAPGIAPSTDCTTRSEC